MEWKLMTKAEASAHTKRWNGLDKTVFHNEMEDWGFNVYKVLNPDYKKLRDCIFSEFNEAKKAVRGPDYSFDLEFGLRFYYAMMSFGFSIRQASIDGIWRDLCVRVFPDIVSYRYGANSNSRLIKKTGSVSSLSNAREERYWNSSRRIYLKTIWWYIHISLQEGDSIEQTKRKTKDALRNCTTDTIVQTVERAGAIGYRIDVNRAIIKYYSNCQVTGSARENLLRRVMVYNTARCVSVEPALVLGGIDGYVKMIFRHCGG